VPSFLPSFVVRRRSAVNVLCNPLFVRSFVLPSFGVREKSANNAKVFFILLTGLLPCAGRGAVLITTSTQRSVYLDIELALQTAGRKDILDVFNASAFLPSCISNAPGITGSTTTCLPLLPRCRRRRRRQRRRRRRCRHRTPRLRRHLAWTTAGQAIEALTTVSSR
jgi:hypothetical protein